MNFKKQIILILIIFSIFLTISSLNAIDQENINETVSIEEVNEELEVNNDVEVLSDTDDGSFAALDAKIAGASDGDTVYLENDYEYKDTDTLDDGVVINKAITVDGQIIQLMQNLKY